MKFQTKMRLFEAFQRGVLSVAGWVILRTFRWTFRPGRYATFRGAERIYLTSRIPVVRQTCPFFKVTRESDARAARDGDALMNEVRSNPPLVIPGDSFEGQDMLRARSFSAYGPPDGTEPFRPQDIWQPPEE